jgi:Uma2 family endonuclease
MTTSTQLNERPAIEYPDDNGEPMADNTLQFKWIVTIKEGLEAVFLHEPQVFVAGDLLWYPVKGDNKIRRAPDALVAFGRPKGYRGSYKQWEEGNQPPQVVFEVLSPGNGPVAMAEKFEFYQRYGVEEYYIYDPEEGPLEGWRRAGDHLEQIPRMAGFVSPRLLVRFEPGPGADNLTILGPDGTPFLSFTEWVEKAKADERRAQAAELRAKATDERAERLAAQLRELGIEPE